MNTYLITIGTDNTFADIELILQAEEASGARFLKLEIVNLDSVDTNLVTFEDLPGNQHPAPLIFKSGVPPPSDNVVTLWKGDVLMADGPKQASAHR